MTEERIAVLWERFRGTTTRRVETLEAWYVGELDHRTALADAHKLTGTLGTLGRPDGSLAAAQLEQMLRAHLEDAQGDPRRDPSVPQLLDRIRACLA
ncbi:Hpt domain-containing protein [Promicromonospora sp. NPDC057138]|uniref:Hpt domain-containing protein n=1 Tax=Promicromonospora sp. NPDC057138 TaxID=3346031 RepID=UPI0036440A5B